MWPSTLRLENMTRSRPNWRNTGWRSVAVLATHTVSTSTILTGTACSLWSTTEEMRYGKTTYPAYRAQRPKPGGTRRVLYTRVRSGGKIPGAQRHHLPVRWFRGRSADQPARAALGDQPLRFRGGGCASDRRGNANQGKIEHLWGSGRELDTRPGRQPGGYLRTRLAHLIGSKSGCTTLGHHAGVLDHAPSPRRGGRLG